MKTLNGFDPRFFLYWEEVDLCARAEWQGFQVWAVGTAVAKHVGGASTISADARVNGCIATHYYQSRFYYMTKHYGRIQAAVMELGEILLLSARTPLDLLRGRGTARFASRIRVPLFSKPVLNGECTLDTNKSV
jgi:N-acetylglucosaminyl-diphospho-decaprenol L-rhamnosyltransferase